MEINQVDATGRFVFNRTRQEALDYAMRLSDVGSAALDVVKKADVFFEYLTKSGVIVLPDQKEGAEEPQNKA